MKSPAVDRRTSLSVSQNASPDIYFSKSHEYPQKDLIGPSLQEQRNRMRNFMQTCGMIIIES